MRTIPLHGAKAAGRVALVDDEDYDLVMRYRWHAREVTRGPTRRTSGPYASVTINQGNGKFITIPMHALITGWPQTDHKDHDGLNNQRFNLRPASRSQNGANRRPLVTKTSSRFKGVCWDQQQRGSKPWRAYITVQQHRHWLGRFHDEEEAARAYDAAARHYFGEYACLNFPDAA
jgi:hypothetical protein